MIYMDLIPINVVSAYLDATSYTIGAGHVWYQTDYGAALDTAAMTSATPFVNSYTGEMGSITVLRNKTFYLGFYIAGDINGWVSLVWNGTTLSLLDSAAETTGVGLYAGTYNAIPEPSAAGFLFCGLAVLTLRRREWRGSQKGYRLVKGES